jgi:hypothetical protein
MLSLIEVRCPHCGAQGQIMLPPVGTIIVGPCPECQGLVVVFCGNVLALEKEIMLNGTIQEKRDHMLTILMGFLKERIAQMISEETESQEPEMAGATGNHVVMDGPGGREMPSLEHVPSAKAPISKEELDAFTNVELKLLDNRDYFKTIFE